MVSVHRQFYSLDAELDVGLTPHKTSHSSVQTANIAARNTTRLNNYLSNNWAGGTYLNNLLIPPKLFLFSGIIKEYRRMGGKVFGLGGRGYIYPELQWDQADAVGGPISRITRIDGENGGPIVRLSGSGSEWTNILFSGRRWQTNYGTKNGTLSTRTSASTGILTVVNHGLVAGDQVDLLWNDNINSRRSIIVGTVSGNDFNISGGVEEDLPAESTSIVIVGGYKGTRPSSCFESEGRITGSGGRRIQDCTIGECTTAINTIPGYYDDSNVFVSDENHADQTRIESVDCLGCDNFFLCQNEQSLNWYFSDCSSNLTDTGGVHCVFNIERGGNITADLIRLNHFRATVLKVKDFNPWTTTSRINNILWDKSSSTTPDNPKFWLTLFKVEGSAALSALKWTARMSGNIPYGTLNADRYYNAARLIEAPAGALAGNFPLDDILLDFKWLPWTDTQGNGTDADGTAKKFERLGHYYYPIANKWLT